MKTLVAVPSRLLRGQANGMMQDFCEIYRNDGYGWDLKGQSRCNVHHLIKPPVPGDPVDASAASTETVVIMLPRKMEARIGDRVYAKGHRWTLGEGNFSETAASYLHTIGSRPTAATPRFWITIRRWDHTTQTPIILPPQLVQLAWSRNQPDRLGGIAIRQYGWIFSPEEATADLDVQQGDTFFYANLEHTVQWVPPDPTERREAIFWTNIGEGV
jgi:hypothetical protein